MTSISTPTRSASIDSPCEVRHLSKRYGTHTVVDDLTFAIPRNQVVGLIGPNGAGKTTTMKMLLGLVRPTGGDISLLGRTVGEPRWGAAHHRVGTMIEAPPASSTSPIAPMIARVGTRWECASDSASRSRSSDAPSS